MEQLEDRRLLTVAIFPQQAPLVCNQLPFVQGVTTDPDGNVFLSYLDVPNTVGDTLVRAFGGMGSIAQGEPLGPAVKTRDGTVLDANAGTLVRVPQGEELPLVQEGDLLNLLQSGQLVAVRPSTGGVQQGLDLRLMNLVVDRSNVYDVAGQRFVDMSGSVNLASSTYNDIAIFNGDGFTDLFISGVSQAQTFPFIIRLRYEADQLQDARVVATTIVGGASPPAPGVAVNEQGVVLTTFPGQDVDPPNLTLPVAFDVNFPEGDGRLPFHPDFGPNNTTLTGQAGAHGIVADAYGNFVIATDLVTNSLTPVSGMFFVTNDLNNLVFLPFNFSDPLMVERDVAVSPDNRWIYLTTNDIPIVPDPNGSRIVYSAVFPYLPDLAPATPSGWSGPLVVSTQTGTNTDAAGITTADTVFVDLALRNRAYDQGVLSGPFQVRLFLDGQLQETANVGPFLNPGQVFSLLDVELGTLSAGQHTLRLVIDYFREQIEVDESNNVFERSFTVTGAPAEIAVELGGANIADGATTPIDFGSVVQGQSGPTRVFTVRNVGGQNLVLGTPSLPAGFSLVEGLAANIAPGGSDTFTGRLDSAAVGTKSGEVTFTTNDLDENPFNFAIAGQVTLPPPEIAVELSGADIPDGSSTAIDFGSVALGQPGPTRVFTVRNTGGADLRQPDRHECRRDGGICEQFERSQARPITASAPTATAWATRPKAT